MEPSSSAEWTPSTPLTHLDLAQRSFAPSATPPASSAPFDSLLSSSEVVNTDGSVYSTNAAQTSSEEEEQLLERPVHDEFTLDAALGTTTPVKRKGRNFSAQEDLYLAGAWLDISQEPVVGDNSSTEC
ncbi:hypothetical protein P3T76_013906 [Phytophthora citrophthora]|uniref:Uncharacterized protein n=1 Tax=Phytophthora citrophthora TaxID=4793 RepID=A0AAD9G212_9STRA|nr:hypothetical protein P3T76_013906 [Phytophthora citrophthora]